MKILTKTILVLFLIGIIYSSFFSDRTDSIIPSKESSKCITIIITINDAQTIDDYCTTKTYLGEVLEEHHEELSIAFTGKKTDPFGRTLSSLNNYTTQKNEFFFIYINDEFGQYGVDQQLIEQGYTYEFRLESY